MKILGKTAVKRKVCESGWFATELPSGAAYRQSFYIKSETSGSFVYHCMLKEAFFQNRK